MILFIAVSTMPSSAKPVAFQQGGILLGPSSLCVHIAKFLIFVAFWHCIVLLQLPVPKPHKHHQYKHNRERMLQEKIS
jgi:hypothetical protein